MDVGINTGGDVCWPLVHNVLSLSQLRYMPTRGSSLLRTLILVNGSTAINNNKEQNPFQPFP